MEKLESLKSVGSVGDVQEYLTFDARSFFKNKVLSLVEIVSTRPLKLTVKIVKDETVYPNNEKNANLNKIFSLQVATDKAMRIGDVANSGEAIVSFDVSNIKARVSYNQLFIETKALRLVDIHDKNKFEVYPN